MPSDEELRKVAEDVRALARSLARDAWDAASSARRSGRPTSEAFRHGLRDAARGARQELQKNMRHGWYGWSGPPRGQPWHGWRHGRPWQPWCPWSPGDAWTPGAGDPDQPGDRPPGPPGGPRPPAGPPWAQWWSPGYPYRGPRRERRGPLPPVRRRWDASVLAALLVVVFGLAWLIGGLGLAPHVSIEAVLAVGLMLLGASLIVTARTDWSLSRHAWPVVLGAVLVVGLFATSTSFGVPNALSHLSFGEMTPRVPPAGGTVYGGFGQLTVHTSDLDNGATLHVENVAGQTVIDLSSSQQATVEAHVLAGQVCVGGQVANGIGASLGPKTVGSANGPKVTIDVHQVGGQVTVVVPGQPQGCNHR